MFRKKHFTPHRRPPSFRPQRRDIRQLLWLAPLLLLAGALLDPSLIAPVGPLAATEQVAATFTPCGPGRGSACVIDGDTFKLGDRKIRIIGIDAPELAEPRCPAEAALARRAKDRFSCSSMQARSTWSRIACNDRIGTAAT